MSSLQNADESSLKSLVISSCFNLWISVGLWTYTVDEYKTIKPHFDTSRRDNVLVRNSCASKVILAELAFRINDSTSLVHPARLSKEHIFSASLLTGLSHLPGGRVHPLLIAHSVLQSRSFLWEYVGSD